MLLQELMEKHGLPAGMLAYASVDVDGQRTMMGEMQGSPLYFTGSREVACAMRELCPHLIASTGGPNTLVNDGWNAKYAEAARLSSTIENSGQCTAMRHLVASGVTAADVEALFDDTPTVTSSLEAIENGAFAGVFKDHPTESTAPPAGYTTHPTLPVAYVWRRRAAMLLLLLLLL